MISTDCMSNTSTFRNFYKINETATNFKIQVTWLKPEKPTSTCYGSLQNKLRQYLLFNNQYNKTKI